MSDPIPDPEPLPPAPHEPDPAFLEEFQKIIEAYAKAANAGHAEEADRLAMEALIKAGTDALAHPTPDLAIHEEIQKCEEAGDWIGAENGYRRLITLREPENNPGLLAKPRFDLSRLFRLIGRLEDAWECARQATEYARKADLVPLTCMILENEVRVALARKDLAHATAAAEEMVRIIPDENLHSLIRARGLTARAECRVLAREWSAAESDLDQSWALLEERGGCSWAPGPRVARARVWEVRAELELGRGHPEAAAAALAKAVEMRRQLRDDDRPTEPFAAAALIRPLERWATVCQQLGRAAQHQALAAEAQAIRTGAHLPAIHPLP